MADSAIAACDYRDPVQELLETCDASSWRIRIVAAMMAPARRVTSSPAPATELEMTTVPIRPLRPGGQAAGVCQRDFVRGHSGSRSVSAILVDIESEARWVQ